MTLDDRDNTFPRALTARKYARYCERRCSRTMRKVGIQSWAQLYAYDLEVDLEKWRITIYDD